MVLELVGAAGFEPTTPLEFNQGALTAELYAYSFVFTSNVFTSNRRYPSDQLWSKHLRPGERQPLPQRHRQPKFRINRAHFRDSLRPDQMITVGQLCRLHRP